MRSGPLLRIGLHIADVVVSALPTSVAYALAELGGRAWYRFAPERRALVAANLQRVLTATGSAAAPRALRRMVRAAFVEHARYYLELLRATHYPLEGVDRIVAVPDWPAYEALLRSGPTVLVSAHVGNFEPFGAYLAAHGFRAVAPVEEIEPRELFEFLRDRRGSGRGVDVVPLSRSRRPMLDALRRGGVVGLIADRDLSGDGLPVELFGAPTTVPRGPATLAVLTGASVIVGRCIRVGRERFEVRAEQLPWQPSGDRRSDVDALTRRIAAHMEADIASAPTQWFGAFQRYWPVNS
jgi:phosphatidylinositol dimannoside acyltransferase